MLTAVPPQLPTPSAMMCVHPSSHLWIRLQVSLGSECCMMPARKASTCTKVGRGKAPEAAQTTNPRAHPKKKARTAAHNSDPAQSRLPVVWRPLGESQPSQEPAAQPKAGLATAPIWGFALSAPPSDVLAVVPQDALPQPSTPLAVEPDGAFLPQPSTLPSATAGPSPDTPSQPMAAPVVIPPPQPMAPPPAAGLPV